MYICTYVCTCMHISMFVEALRRIESRRFAETVSFPCKMTNKYCRDSRRRRIRAKTAQKMSKAWLVKFPICLRTFYKPV